MRECTECKGKMVKGFVIDNGSEYYCKDECLGKHYTVEEYEKMYENDNAYYTEWEE